MKTIEITAICILSLGFVIIFLMAVYFGKPVKKLLVNALLGFTVMTIINITKKFTGVYIPVNWVSVLGVGVFSIPAVIGLLLLNLII